MILRIGTRGSALALAQTEEVCALLKKDHPDSLLEIRIIKTSGDRIQDRPLADLGGKVLFTKEIQEALRTQEIDIAVHSLKDMEAPEPQDLCLAAVLPRLNPYDAWISREGLSWKELPQGAVVGTSSLRRAHQIQQLRPDLRIQAIRGNVDTRLSKLHQGLYDGIILASAGLQRLGKEHLIHCIFSPEEMVPAAGQGVIAIECRAGDEKIHDRIKPLDDSLTRWAITAERAFTSRLGGDCHSILGAYAREQNLSVYAVQPGISDPIRTTRWGQDPISLGEDVADWVLTHKIR